MIKIRCLIGLIYNDLEWPKKMPPLNKLQYPLRCFLVSLTCDLNHDVFVRQKKIQKFTNYTCKQEQEVCCSISIFKNKLLITLTFYNKASPLTVGNSTCPVDTSLVQIHVE